MEKRVFAKSDVMETKDLRFFIFNNLRFQQDGMKSEVYRFDTLQEAVEKFNVLPKEYTAALGVTLDERSELDLIHRVNGEAVLIKDYIHIEKYANNPAIQKVVSDLVYQLNICYELNGGLFNVHSSQIKSPEEFCAENGLEAKDEFKYLSVAILTPLADHTRKLDSYFKDKTLLCKPHVNNLLHSINEVYIEGKGWVAGKEFMKHINKSNYNYNNAALPIVSRLNINYVDVVGHKGQADISPYNFTLLRQQTIEQAAKKPEIDKQIKAAHEKRNNEVVDKREDREFGDR